ncbi:hypothetical protein CNR22_05815 [Sphingobacteriaceae bacterium]|nr:hypothetical protein CNR22_05815 [Sphingobacteriaceae bacterium]
MRKISCQYLKLQINKSKSYQDVGEWLSPLNKVDFLRILIFNFLTGNGDVHLKNISLLETAH